MNIKQLSLILIEAIENTLNTLDVIHNDNIDWTLPDNKEWMDTWKIWFKSNILKNNWNKYQTQFSTETSTFLNTFILK